MRKYFVNYYALIILIIFIIYSLFLGSLKIYGLLYQVFMFLLIISNAIILINFRKKIKCKTLITITYLLIWLYSKNSLQCIFVFSNIIILCITGFFEKNFIKISSVLIIITIYVFFFPLYFVYLIVFGTGLNEEKGMNDIYDDTHYYCDNNYEVYSYSAGAMDSFHYSIGKHYDILNISSIINISYRKRNEVPKEEYDNYLKTHNCRLVGDINGSK